MITKLKHWWWRQQRDIDLEVLWPACKEQTPTLDHARAVFAVHAFQDPAWIEFYGKDKLVQIIGAMT